MRRIPGFVMAVLRRYGRRLLRGRVVDPAQLQALVDAATASLPTQASLFTREGSARDASLNRQLAWSMAFVAGAVNAGGYMAVSHYTSHMTGLVSSMAEAFAQSEWAVAFTALALVGSFMAGAFVSTTLISLGQRMHLRSRYAIGLLLEAALLLLFGLTGARLHQRLDVYVPLTVALLCFIMGHHNALTTNLSGAAVRTTHLTGVVTDIGIELGRLLYVNVKERPGLDRILADRAKLKLVGLVFASFVAGAVSGTYGFNRFGFKVTVPLAAFLCLLAGRPVLQDLRVYLRLFRRNLLKTPSPD